MSVEKYECANGLILWKQGGRIFGRRIANQFHRVDECGRLE